ncbi:hypothetical protein [Pedosphaera parvula]|uniref:Lipoprotein n=1 Tax=Pedosphaera parvula (strain Ellin514) TaxID=320771 RepID=B9XBU4_PEDPL|nr:hypothetical protein [Pedosphaera parvula]EEF62412.1 hypothetical protein Cflav_PD5047 [Pedosphaera parvula Ellin514]
MKIANAFVLTLCLSLLTGCGSLKDITLTGALWSDEFLLNNHVPTNGEATTAFIKADQKDVLITYDERQDRKDKVKRRAFFVLENQHLLATGGKPHFVPLKNAVGREPVPILWEANTVETNTYSSALIISTNQWDFQLVLTNQNLGHFHMPVYADEHSRGTQILLTPFAVAGDTGLYTVIGFGLIMLAVHNGDTNSWQP